MIGVDVESLGIYVVREGSVLDGPILPGSAVVGHPQANGLLVFYEGNAYGADNLHAWSERVMTAAGRAFENYPTTAKRLLAAGATDLVRVGAIDRSYRITIEEPQLVAQCEQRYRARTGRHG